MAISAGALELMEMAYDATAPAETEDRAWMLRQTSRLGLLSRRPGESRKSRAHGARIFPEYHYALAALAQVRMAQGRYDDAVSLLRKRYQAAPHTENLYALAEAQELAGQHEEAQASFRKFEGASRCRIPAARTTPTAN